jgi:hypothetical protein
MAGRHTLTTRCDVHSVTNPAAPEPAPEPTPAPKRRKRPDWVPLVVITVIGAAIIAVVAAGALGDPDPEDAVKDACQSSVESRLKAPSSADFGGQIATDDGGGSWTVEGSVDAQNSFGAMMRTDYTCTVDYNDGDVFVTDVTTN